MIEIGDLVSRRVLVECMDLFAACVHVHCVFKSQRFLGELFVISPANLDTNGSVVVPFSFCWFAGVGVHRIGGH